MAATEAKKGVRGVLDSLAYQGRLSQIFFRIFGVGITDYAHGERGAVSYRNPKQTRRNLESLLDDLSQQQEREAERDHSEVFA
jgi:hypothetical protein